MGYKVMTEMEFYKSGRTDPTFISPVKQFEPVVKQEQIAQEQIKTQERQMVDIDSLIDDEVTVKVTEIEDARKVAVKFSFLGMGQAGGNLADSFHKVGYRRVAVANTTEKDMQRLDVKNRYVMPSPGGAGKNPAVGKECAEKAFDELLSLCSKSFGSKTEYAFACAGLGGGTGGGSVFTAIEVLKEYMKSINVENVNKKVGAIVTLPTKDESAAVHGNAVEALEKLCKMAEAGEISPLVIIDNQKVMEMYGGASVIDVWSKANKNIAALFHVFNELAAQDDASVVVTFDPEDYKSVLSSGILAFGRTKITDTSSQTAIAEAVRSNVKKGLLVDHLDITKASNGAGVLLADEMELAKVSQDMLESAFGTLNRMMKQGPETKLHRGVIAARGQSVALYTLIAGFGAPTQKIQEMKSKSGK